MEFGLIRDGRIGFGLQVPRWRGNTCGKVEVSVRPDGLCLALKVCLIRIHSVLHLVEAVGDLERAAPAVPRALLDLLQTLLRRRVLRVQV